MHKCKKRIQVDILNDEVKGWTPSSNQQEDPTEPTNTKDEVLLEEMKQKLEK